MKKKVLAASWVVCDQTTDYIEKNNILTAVNMDSGLENLQCQHGLICSRNGP